MSDAARDMMLYDAQKKSVGVATCRGFSWGRLAATASMSDARAQRLFNCC